MKTVKENAVKFLEAMGFKDVHPIMGDPVRMMVKGALKVSKKRLKAPGFKFSLIEQDSTKGATVQRYYVIKNRQILGQLHLSAYVTHSVVELINA